MSAIFRYLGYAILAVVLLPFVPAVLMAHAVAWLVDERQAGAAAKRIAELPAICAANSDSAAALGERSNRAISDAHDDSLACLKA